MILLLFLFIKYSISANVPYPIEVFQISKKSKESGSVEFINDIKKCLGNLPNQTYSLTNTTEAEAHFKFINEKIKKYNKIKRPPYNTCNGPFLENEFIKRYKSKPLSYFFPLIPLFVPWFTIWKKDKGYPKIAQEILDMLKPEYLYFVLSESDFGFTGDDFKQSLPSNTLVFSASGMGHVAVPWIQCNYKVPKKVAPEYFLSFCGNPRSSGERKETLNMARSLLGPYFYECRDPNWEEVVQKSLFVLSPRGIAVATYRTFEILQMEAIPVIFTDHVHWLPYFPKLNWSKFSFLTNVQEFARTALRLRTMKALEIDQMKKELHYVNKEFFQWDGFFKQLDAFFEGKDHFFSCSRASLTFP